MLHESPISDSSTEVRKTVPTYHNNSPLSQTSTAELWENFDTFCNHYRVQRQILCYSLLVGLLLQLHLAIDTSFHSIFVFAKPN